MTDLIQPKKKIILSHYTQQFRNYFIKTIFKKYRNMCKFKVLSS